MVAAAFHGNGKLVCPAEGRDKQRHEYRQQRLCPLYEIAGLKVCASCLLGGHYLVRLLDERRDKAQRHAHHHAHLVHGNFDFLQRIEQYLKTVGERDGARGVGQKEGTDYEEDYPHRHHDRLFNALPSDYPALDYRRALGVENIQKRRQDDDEYDGL